MQRQAITRSGLAKNKNQPPFSVNGRAARSEAKRWRGTRTLRNLELQQLPTAHGRLTAAPAHNFNAKGLLFFLPWQLTSRRLQPTIHL